MPSSVDLDEAQPPSSVALDETRRVRLEPDLFRRRQPIVDEASALDGNRNGMMDKAVFALPAVELEPALTRFDLRPQCRVALPNQQAMFMFGGIGCNNHISLTCMILSSYQ